MSFLHNDLELLDGGEVTLSAAANVIDPRRVAIEKEIA
jgi:hypothetical protein